MESKSAALTTRSLSITDFCSRIHHKDAKKILLKLEQYGSWTRLARMSEAERTKELVNRSKKQLLIALLEATLGRGFERIIEEEYSAIKSEEEKFF
ncbi:hypothetical protein NWF32_04520 [Pseudomonas qingdaonensis]|nr:hypothetical protein [Pseudomonas qingdaonensis]